MPPKFVNIFAAVTAAAKAAAREERLIKATIREEEKLREENIDFNNFSASNAKASARAEKEASIAEFALSSTTTANPEYEDLQKEATQARKDADTTKATLATELATRTTAHDKVVAEITAKIAEIQSGDVKVDHEKQLERAKELISKTVEGQYLNGDFDSATQ
jgi:murein L,D-transpeptidase YcbB/YkuD